MADTASMTALRWQFYKRGKVYGKNIDPYAFFFFPLFCHYLRSFLLVIREDTALSDTAQESLKNSATELPRGGLGAGSWKMARGAHGSAARLY